MRNWDQPQIIYMNYWVRQREMEPTHEHILCSLYTLKHTGWLCCIDDSLDVTTAVELFALHGLKVFAAKEKKNTYFILYKADSTLIVIGVHCN